MKKRFRNYKKRKITIIKRNILYIIIIAIIIYTLKTMYNFYDQNINNETIIDNIISSKLSIKDTEEIIPNKLEIKTNPKDTTPVQKEIKDDYDIYIYNTHDTENYSNNITEPYNIIPNIMTMNYILKENLEKYNIKTYVEEERTSSILKKNKWSYQYSYKASRTIIENKIDKYKNLKLIIDLHRDSGTHSKTTLEYQKKNYAKVMFVIGKEYNTYEENYKIAKEISDIINDETPSLSKGILLKSGPGVNGIYNQDLNNKIILIELGGEENEIEELNNTIEILAKCISKYLGGNQNRK